MEEFRIKLEKKKKICSCISLLSFFSLIPICIISHFYQRADILISLAFVMLVLTIIQRAEINKALKNEDTFKKMYVRETDERNIKIREMAGNAAIYICMTILVLGAEAALIFGNNTIAFTLVAASLVLITTYLATLTYFRKKL